MDEAGLRAAVMSVDVLDLCGRIIARPDRAMVSHAAKIAMAHLIEHLWEIGLEAELLARAVELPGGELRELALEKQAGRVRELLAAIRENTPKQETENGSDIR